VGNPTTFYFIRNAAEDSFLGGIDREGMNAAIVLNTNVYIK
jgi:hypothetical protein